MVSVSDYVLMAAQSYFYYRAGDEQPFVAPGWTPLSINFSGFENGSSEPGIYTSLGNGFSATIFQKGSGANAEYVIAYRGTDNWTGDPKDAWQNLLLGVPTVGPQTRNAIALVEALRAQGVDLTQISFTGHSLGGGLAGIVSGLYDRPAVIFDPAPYVQELSDLAQENYVNGQTADGLYNQYLENARENVDIIRVQGEVLDVIFGEINYAYKSYQRIDLGDTDWENSSLGLVASLIPVSLGLAAAVGYDIINGEPRKLHHISTMVLAVLGREQANGESIPILNSKIGEVYETLVEQKDLLSRLIDENLTALKSLEQDSENNSDQDPSHGNFERKLVLNQAFAADFVESFKKTDDDTSGGGQDRIIASLLKNDEIRDAVINLGFITARKLADQLDYANPSGASYLGSIFGSDPNSVVLSMRVLNTEYPLERDDQISRLSDEISSLYLSISSTYAPTVLEYLSPLWENATHTGADAEIIFGSIAGSGSNYTIDTGFGLFFGGDLDDRFVGAAGDDFFDGGEGGDVLTGAAGNDVILGGGGDDTLFGGDGVDLLEGNDANDRIIGGRGNDKDIGERRGGLYGGFGDDLLISELNDGDDDIDGGLNGIDLPLGDGTDTVVYKYYRGDSTVSINSTPFIGSQKPSDFGLTIDGARDANNVAGSFEDTTDVLTSIERAAVEAGDGSDSLVINDDSDVSYIQYVDLGGQGAAFSAYDKLDVSALSTNVTVDLRNASDQVLYINDGAFSGSELRLRDVENVNGTEYNDVLYGTNAAQGGQLRGNGGNDQLISGAGASVLEGGDGNDLLVAGGVASHLFGGSGTDRFVVGANATIEDAEQRQGEETYYAGMRLTGGVKQWWMEGNAAYYAPFTSLSAAFPVIGSELIATAAIMVDSVTLKFVQYSLLSDGTLAMMFGWGQGGTAYLENYDIDFNSGVGSAGISVFQVEVARQKWASQQNIDKYVNLALYSGFGHGLPGYDPLVLDLNGDGFNLVAENVSSTYFEFDTDGFGEHAGWVRGSDGFLVRDADANGKIDNVTEMFGNETTGGFDVLAGYDANLDGVINASDGAFASLSVWQDLDQDGVTDAGELKSLAELGIVSISLTHSAPADPTVIGGNTISQLGSFTRADGSTGGVADVLLGLNETNSKWLGDNSVSSAAETLPQLSGFGELKDLRVAMTADATLASLVEDYVALDTTDLSLLEDGAEAILYRWAGIDGVTLQALGSEGFDTRKLAFLEKYTGYELMPRDALGAIELDNIDEVEALWADQLTRLTLRLVVQGPLAEAFDGITYNAERDLLVASSPTALGNLLKGLLEDLPSDPTAASTQWANWAPLLGALTESMVRFDANIVRGDYVFAQLVAAMDGVTQPLTLAQLTSALGIANVAIGTAGNETLARSGSGAAILYSNGGDDQLNGGSGQDVYVFGRQIGHATITDIEAREAGDRIRFAFLNPDDVSMARSGADLLIIVTATGETVRVTGQFADVTPGGGDLLLSSNKGVEDIQFANGTVMEIPAIMIAVGTGTDGNDHLIGSMHSDALTGGKGNDLLQGGDDADLYVVNAGDGQDVIEEIQSTPLLRSADMLIFGDDIAPDDLVVSRVGEGGNDLLFTIGTSGQSVLIRNQFTYTSLGYTAPLSLNSRIEAFGFRDYGDSWSYKDIQQKVITQSITAGADVTRGFGDADTFQASAGNDLLIGMDGADTYAWGKRSGNDTIDEQALFIDVEVGLGGISLTTRADTVQFSQGVSLADLQFSRASSAPDLTITITSTGETLTIKKQFNGIQTGVLGAQWFDRIEWFELADGTRLSWQDVEALVTTGGAGDDHLYGDILPDVMKGNGGNDTLSGGGAGDLYVFNVGDGQDVVDDANYSFLGEGFLTVDGSPDILQLGAGITEADISFGRSGQDVVLIIGTNGDQVTLKGQDNYIHTGVFGDLSPNRVEEIRFADGTVWTWQILNQRMIAAATTPGDDVTLGTSTEDDFAVSAGNDLIVGQDGNDDYSFGRGSGHDRIQESLSNIFAGDYDRLNFEAGVTLADLGFSRDGGDLIITILDTSDSVRVLGQFSSAAGYLWNDLEAFSFADGTTLTDEDVRVKLLTSSSGNDHLVGFIGADRLDGGSGDDILQGGDGNDTYVFNRGYGHDVIQEQSDYIFNGDYDSIAFGTGITLEDLGFTREGDDLVITILDTLDTLRVEGQFSSAAGYLWHDVESFVFADGTSITDADVRAKILIGTSGNDTLVGFVGSDTLDGKGGDDILAGGDGNDTYIFGRGYGHDMLYEQSDYIFNGDWDQLNFLPGITLADLGFARTGDDLIITILDTGDSLRIDRQFEYQADFYSWRDIELFNFADGSSITKADVQQILLTGGDGDDTLIGYITDDTFTGGKGDDVMSGGKGADRYVYNVGDGDDVISDYVFVFGGSGDRIVLGTGITPTMLQVSASVTDPADMVISFDGIPGSITIDNQILGGIEWGIDIVEFADGSSWTAQDLTDRLNLGSGTDGDDDINGTTLNDTLFGGLGNDVINGFDGNDLLNGGGGTDSLLGGNGIDILDGGSGNDLLAGDQGDDTYRYAVGGGNDVVSEYAWYYGSTDTLELGEGIAPEDILFGRASDDSSDMVLSFVGTAGSVTLDKQLNSGGEWGIERVKFADGTIWDRMELNSRFLASFRTSGNDTITGTWMDDTILGGAGNDSLEGYDGADTLDGEGGDDILAGGSGDDIYRYGLNGGNDIVSDYAWYHGSYDILELGAGIAQSDVTFSRASTPGGDLVMHIGAGSVALDNQLNAGGEWSIDLVRFADGSSWTAEQLNTHLFAALSTAGADTIDGSWRDDVLNGAGGNDIVIGNEGNDVLDGGAGDDRIEGGAGDDIYLYAADSGNDVISEYTWWTGSFNRLILGAGITTSEVRATVSTADQADVILTFTGHTGSVTIENQILGDGTWGIDTVEFADGTIWDPATLINVMFASMSTPGDDVISGTPGNDVISSGMGNDIIKGGNGADDLSGGPGVDRLEGASGDDVYRFNLGDGQDTIYDNNEGWWYGSWTLLNGGNDRLELGSGINPTDVAVVKQGTNDILLKFRDATDQLLLQGVMTSTERQIETINFADGTTWSHADIMQRAHTSTPGDDVIDAGASAAILSGGDGNDTLIGSEYNDVLYGDPDNDTLRGNGGADTLVGGTGTDRLEGAAGDDIYRFNAGDGQDTIYDNNEGWWYGNWTLFDGGNDRLELGAGINPTDIDVVEQGADNLLLKVRGTNDQILFQGAVSATQRRIEAVRFADGTVWTHADLMQRALTPTIGDDVFYAGTQPMTISGGDGNDTLTGSDGADIIAGDAGNDTIDARDGNDVVSGGIGNDMIKGGNGSDDLAGGLGTDRLEGGGSDDIYRFNAGDGQDTIYDNNEGWWYGNWTLFDGGNDRLELAAGINPADIDVVEQGADNLLLKVRGTSDQILLQGVVSTTQRRLEAVQFADGTVWTHADLMQRALTPTPGDDVFYAGILPMTISGGDGNDTLTGSDGNDTLSGDAGNDTLRGGNGNDILTAGTGIDRLEGAAGDDVYRFNIGDGEDTIYDNIEGWSYGNWTLFDGGTDRLELGTGISPANVDVVKQGATDLLLKVRGTSDQILLQGAASASQRRIETVRFADGTVWTHDDIIALSLITPPAIAANAVIAGAVTEQAATTGATSSDSVSGALRFTDGTAGATHSIAINSVNVSGSVSGLPSNSALLALLSFGAVTEPDGTAEGVSTWAFSAQDSLFDYLAAGQTTQLAYSITLSNNNGRSVSQDITVAITGTNDLPLIATDTSASGSISELAATAGSSANDTTSGVLRFTDGDTPDTHSASIVSVTTSGATLGLPANATVLNWLSKGVLAGQAGATAGSLPWSFAAPDSAFDYLGAGQTAALTYAIQITDNVGGTVTQNVVITATGTNDTPLIAAGTTATGAITELASTTGSTANDMASGTMRFTDLDLADAHNGSVLSVSASGTTSGLPTNATLLAMLGLGTITEQAGSIAGSLSWTFAAQDKTFDYLGAGQSTTLTYVVQLSDGNGGSVSQNVAVTITGTNDTPQVSAGTTSGGITELALVTGSSTSDTASGTLKFVDADPADTHSATILSVAASGTTSGLPTNTTLLGWLSKGTLTEQSGATPGSLPWSFAAPDSAFDYLGAGQTAMLTYVIRTADSQGSNLDQPVVVTITGSNDAPTAQTKSGFTTDNWTALTIAGSTLTAGATDADTSDALTLSSVQSPVGGTVAINAGNAVFTPTATAVGPASFTYTISDGHGGSSTATVNLTTTLHQINGTSGNDTLSGGAKPSQINGGAGNDTITAGSAGDTLVGGAGTDTLKGGSGVDTVDYSANAVAQTINLSLTSSQTISSGDVDTITNVENAIGGSGNDTITGSTGNNVLAGNGGNDSLNGGSGSDTLLGGDGDDTLTGAAGNDTVDGGNGIDTVSYSANSVAQTINLTLSTAQTIASGDVDTIINVENVIGGTGADTITGSTGNNILNGGSGNDTINGNDGNDTLIGGAGNDVLNGGAGIDTVDYSANTVAQTINLTLTAQQTISSGNLDTLSNIENVLGGTGADTITGSIGNNLLNGGAGNDNINGNDGDDTLVGGTGTDTLNGGNGIDTVDYSYGTVAQTINLSLTTSQTISSGDADTISNIENVIAGSGNDTITGSTAGNSLDGGLGNDRLTGGTGNDTIIGGTGSSDIAVFAGAQTSYTIATNAGVVTITDNQPSTDGNDGIDTVSGIEKVEFKGAVQVGITSPIVLDLNGDGVSLLDNQATNAAFDWDADGHKDQTGWIGADDGFLMFDRDGNGTVSNGNELSFTSDKHNAKSDLDGLRAFDSNGDGIFSAYDEKFDQFKIWQDKNSNGTAEENEVFSLATAGVSAINLVGNAVNQNWNWGQNMTINTGSFTLTDGSTSSFSDVALSYDALPRGVLPFGQRISLPEDRYTPLISLKEAAQLTQAIAAFGIESRPDEMSVRDEWGDRPDYSFAIGTSGMR